MSPSCSKKFINILKIIFWWHSMIKIKNATCVLVTHVKLVLWIQKGVYKMDHMYCKSPVNCNFFFYKWNSFSEIPGKLLGSHLIPQWKKECECATLINNFANFYFPLNFKGSEQQRHIEKQNKCCKCVQYCKFQI